MCLSFQAVNLSASCLTSEFLVVAFALAELRFSGLLVMVKSYPIHTGQAIRISRYPNLFSMRLAFFPITRLYFFRYSTS